MKPKLGSVIREPDDRLALRASIGGREKLGYYLVFRGDPEKVIKMLEDVVAEAKTALSSGDYTDKRNRPQG